MAEDFKDQTNIVPEPSEEVLLSILDGADPFEDAAGQIHDRSDLEALGLLSYSLPEASVSPRSRAALLERIRMEGARVHTDPSGQGADVVLPFAAAAQPTNRASVDVGDRRAASGWLPLALAAAVLLAVGLGIWGGFQTAQLHQSKTLVAGLESELREVRELGPGTDDFQRVLFENQRLRQEIGSVVQRDTKVCVLSATNNQPEAAGTAFLRPQEGRWVIATNNLKKCELGRRYRLWFLGEDGSVMGGEVLEHVNGEQPVEMASGELPEGTRALLVTLEFPDQFGDEPSGERVLYGDQSVEIY